MARELTRAEKIEAARRLREEAVDIAGQVDRLNERRMQLIREATAFEREADARGWYAGDRSEGSKP